MHSGHTHDIRFVPLLSSHSVLEKSQGCQQALPAVSGLGLFYTLDGIDMHMYVSF